MEDAKGLSSRGGCGDILKYKAGMIDLDNLTTIIQPKYDKGVEGLEYLLKAERFVDGHIIAGYIADDYMDNPSIAYGQFAENDEISVTLYSIEDYYYWVILSPVFSEEQRIGYDMLIFDTSALIQTINTEKVKLELISQDEFEGLISGAKIPKSYDESSLFYSNGDLYNAFQTKGGTYFTVSQSVSSLLQPVRDLTKQVLHAGISVVLIFALTIYFCIIRQAKDKLEDSNSSLKEAMTEANTDPLTKTGSRRFGMDVLGMSFERFKKGEPSPAIILFDIDFLTKVNDEHGHTVGDLVIVSIAEAVQENIRSEDILVRWGGDEFIGIFSGLSKENSFPFAEKVLDAISSLTIETDKEVINPTISIGISYFNEKDYGFIDTINRADRAMYQSKSEGKNRVNIL